MALRSLTETVYDRSYPSGLNHLFWEIKANENGFEKRGKMVQSINHIK